MPLGNIPDIKSTIPNSEDIAQAFVNKSFSQIEEKKQGLGERKELSQGLTDNSGKTPGWNSDPEFETERFVNDAFIKNTTERIRRMQDAIEVLKQRQSIVAKNGEISQRKFGDVIWGYKTTFSDVGGTTVEEELNVILVPSALVGEGEFKIDRNGEQAEFTVVSPVSEIGERIVESSL